MYSTKIPQSEFFNAAEQKLSRKLKKPIIELFKYKRKNLRKQAKVYK